MLKENIVLKWVHRFGINSLNDLLIHSSALKEYCLEENQEQINLMDEVDEGENQEEIKLELSKTIENIKEKKYQSNGVESYSLTGVFSKNQKSNNIKKLSDAKELPLPNIKNLRKWINNDKKAS